MSVSSESFQARWIERTYENGANTTTEHFTAVLTVATQTPRDAETLRNNPLGIFVHAFNWAEDLDMGDDQ